MDNLTFVWSRDPTTGEEYGLLAEIIGKVKYTHLTNLVWIQEVELPRYGPAITNATRTDTDPHKEMHGGGMGGETQIVVHLKRIPMWHYNKYAG